MTWDWTFSEFATAIGAPKRTVAVLEGDLAAELASVVPIKGAVLKRLHRHVERGERVGIVSNLARPYADAVLRLLPPLEVFVWSYSVDALKPERKIFIEAASALGVPPAQILMTGDSWYSDILGARAVGWRRPGLANDGSAWRIRFEHHLNPWLGYYPERFRGCPAGVGLHTER